MPGDDNLDQAKPTRSATGLGFIQTNAPLSTVNMNGIAFHLKTPKSLSTQYHQDDMTPPISSIRDSETYPKLERLAIMATQVERNNVRKEICFRYLQTEHKLHELERLTGNVRDLNRCLESNMTEDQDYSARTLGPKLASTRWQSEEAWKASSSLYHVLSRRLKNCECKHQAKLQLNGFALDQWETSSLFNVFLSLLSSQVREIWKECRCVFVQK